MQFATVSLPFVGLLLASLLATSRAPEAGRVGFGSDGVAHGTRQTSRRRSCLCLFLFERTKNEQVRLLAPALDIFPSVVVENSVCSVH